MTRYIPIILLAAVLLALGLFALVRCNTPPIVVTVTPVVVTVTPSATATSTPKPSISPSATIAPPTATVTPDLPPMTATPTVSITEIVPTATPATPLPTPDLLGTHRVKRGQTMWGIALEWYPRRWFLWAEHAWRPICDSNPQIVDCRMIFVGDVLAIPRLR